jgi:hypothetical protein
VGNKTAKKKGLSDEKTGFDRRISVGTWIEADIWRASLHLRERTDLCHRGVRHPLVQIQPEYALLYPLRAANQRRLAKSKENWMVLPTDQSEFQKALPTCERFYGDIAVLAVGALEGLEKCRLLRHIDGCRRCTALREEFAEIVSALDVLCGRDDYAAALHKNLIVEPFRWDEMRSQRRPCSPPIID